VYTLHNEPVTFDPAVKDIARELSRLFARVRTSLRGVGSGRMTRSGSSI